MGIKSTLGRSLGKSVPLGRSRDLAGTGTGGAAKHDQLNSRYVGARAKVVENAPYVAATGGTTSEPGDGYKYHIYTNATPGPTCNFTVTSPGPIEYIVVGGGGGGGGHAGGGGGGAGGVRTNIVGHPRAGDPYTVNPGLHVIQIGDGGTGAPPSGDPQPNGTPGGNTNFYPDPASYPDTTYIRAAGGGRGGGGNPQTQFDRALPAPPAGSTGETGGCGGGTGSAQASNPYWTAVNPGVIADPNHPEVQGYKGGSTTDQNYGGGGGGAGGVGGDPNPTNTSGAACGGRGGCGGIGVGFPLPMIGGPTLAPSHGADGPTTEPYGSGGRWFGGGGGGGCHAPGNGGPGGGGISYPGPETYAGGGHGTPAGDGTDYPGTAHTGGGGSGAGGQQGAFADDGGNGGSGWCMIRYEVQ